MSTDRSLLEEGIVAAFNQSLKSRLFVTEAKAIEFSAAGHRCISLTSTELFNHFYQHVNVIEADGKSLTISAATSATPPMMIFVKDLKGIQKAIHCYPSDTMAVVKGKIDAQFQIAVVEQRLIFAGKQLEDWHRMVDYNIQNGSTIHLVRRVQGARSTFHYVNASFFHPAYDYDFTNVHDSLSGEVYRRGGRLYTRPCGCHRFALKALGLYEDDKWLGCSGALGEWPVAYHGTEEVHLESNMGEGCSLEKRQKFEFGPGIFCMPDPQTAMAHGAAYEFQGKRYRLIIQTRVDPAAITVVKQHDEYWTVPDGKALRPYGICIFPIDG